MTYLKDAFFLYLTICLLWDLIASIHQRTLHPTYPLPVSIGVILAMLVVLVWFFRMWTIP